MPSHRISFSFTIEGALTDVFAFANGIPIQKWQANGKFVGGFIDALADEGTDVKITFVVLGLNGTAYKIVCQFQDNGVSEPGSQPTPIEGTIQRDMKAQEEIIYHV